MMNAAFFEPDLAYIHDVGFGGFAEKAAPFLLRALVEVKAARGSPSGLVVDLGCGGGIWARVAADAGYQVLGVDVSAAMIEIARRRVPEATFHVGSVADFSVPECCFVTALGEVFNYFSNTDGSRPDLRRVWQSVFDSLVPNGVFIFDVAQPERCREATRSFWEKPDWACLVEFDHNEMTKQLIRRIVTFRKVGATYRRHEETHRQQLYETREVAEILRQIGFKVELIPGYGPVAFPPGVAGIVARKPGPQ